MATVSLSALAADNTTDLNIYLTYDSTCTGWTVNETKDLPSGHLCIGDVIVNGVQRYDNGTGEDTVVLVTEGTPKVTITAKYGAGEQKFDTKASLSDLRQQICLQEFARTETKTDGTTTFMFHTIRIVMVDKRGQVAEEYIKRADFFSAID